MMNYYVYIIFSESRNRYYAGHTHELDKRIRDHNSGWSTYTKRGMLWQLMKYFECVSKGAAMELEMRIKKRGIKRYLSDLAKTG